MKMFSTKNIKKSIEITKTEVPQIFGIVFDIRRNWTKYAKKSVRQKSDFLSLKFITSFAEKFVFFGYRSWKKASSQVIFLKIQ